MENSQSIFDAWSETNAPAEQQQVEASQPEQVETQQESVVETQAQVETQQEPQGTSEAIENNEPQAPKIDDNSVLEYLNGQLGTQYSSLQELKAAEQPKDDLNPLAKSFNDYAKETGKGLNDWIKLQNLSSYLTDSKDEDIVRIKFEYENPHLSPDEVADLFEAEYNKIAIDEDYMDEAEIEKAKKHNRLVDIRLKSAAVQAKDFLNGQIEKYKAPEIKQEGGSFDVEGFEDNYKNFLNNEIEELEFDLGDNNTFSIKVDDSLKQTSVNTPEDFLNSFVDEQGNWDYERWASVMMVTQHIDKILKIAVDQKSSEAKEQVIKDELKNTNISGVHKKDENPSQNSNPFKTMGSALWG